MGTLGTFDAFTSSRLGIYAAMQGLRVTGNNISNISTEGYTRQRIDQVSLKTGGADMYRSQLDNHVGNGALVTGINQIRDPYLDIRYRNTNADVGYTDTWLSGLQDIQSILDEVGKGLGEDEEDGILYAQLQDLAEALRGFSENPAADNNTLVRTSAESLCNLFHIYSNKLETLRLNTHDAFKKDIDNVNGILTNIRNLNEEIRRSEIHGDNALEMRDERNRQIDALSEYMHIKVVYTMEDLGAGQEVEKLTISLANDNPDESVTTDSSVLIDGIYGAQISMQRPMANPDYDPAVAIGPDNLPYWNAEEGKAVEKASEATMEDDPNYTITISKLYDSKGRLWTNPVTTWTPVNGDPAPAKSKFRFAVQRGTIPWTAGDPTATPPVPADTFTVAGITCTVGAQTDAATNTISAADANNPEKMAAFIAERLNANAADYDITSQGAYVVFTAKDGKEGKPGVDAGAPAAEPTLTVTDPGGKIQIGQKITVNPGETTVAPGKAEITYDDAAGTKTEISYTKIKNQWYEIKTVTQYSKEVTLDDNDLHGSLQATRELLTEKGNFATQDTVDNIDENATIKRGIPYYQMSLDMLARQIANQYNKLNQGFMVNQDGNYIDETGKPVTLAGDDGVEAPISKTNGLTPAQKRNLINNGYVLTDAAGNIVLDDNNEPVIDMDKILTEKGAMKPEGMGVLFSNNGDNDDPTEITAANINVSIGWSSGNTKVIPTFIQLFGEDGKPLANSTQNENANHMVTMIEQSLVYDPTMMDPDAVGGKLFEGCFNDMFSNMMSVRGKDHRIMNVKLTTSYASLVELDTSRDGVSGVDLNDEAMNMMQYQKAYSAACRLMTAVDEALDRLINNTGIAGR